MKPERLNLAIGNKCFVHCQGCFQNFGDHEPRLDEIFQSIRAFIRLGIDHITFSGGDPLTIAGFCEFLDEVKSLAVRSIKVDTVGTSLLGSPDPASVMQGLSALLARIDYLGLPLDGWSNSSIMIFRKGRPSLYDETRELLNAIILSGHERPVIINTVAHQHNRHGFRKILDEVSKHKCVFQWNIFQYFPSDQASDTANEYFEISDQMFAKLCSEVADSAQKADWAGGQPRIEFTNGASRLGRYLLINSDGSAWTTSRYGRTIHLGSIFQREEIVLTTWTEKVVELRRGIEEFK